MRAGHYRRVRLCHAEVFQQSIHVRGTFYIYPGEEHAISGKKIAYRKRSGERGRPDDTKADEVRRFAQQLSARNKSLENNIAQARTLIQYMPQSFCRDLVCLAIAAGNRR